MHRSVLAQTPTPTSCWHCHPVGFSYMHKACVHTRAHAHPQRLCDPGIQLQAACLGGLGASRLRSVPTTALLGSSPTGLCPRGTPRPGVPKGNLQIPVPEPRQNKLGNKRGFPCSKPLLRAQTCALAFSQARSPVVPCAPALPCHHFCCICSNFQASPCTLQDTLGTTSDP